MAVKYVTYEDIRLRLVGKVKFTEDPNNENHMQKALALKLIEEAEGQVEQDLSPRYAAPFAHINGTVFKTLPDSPTKQILKTLCELQACMRILETDFGAGTAIDAEKYSKNLEKRYEKILFKNLLAKVAGAEDSKQWLNPPLPGLAKNWFNQIADDGFTGGIYVTGSGDGGYARNQINDPSETFWNAEYDND